MNSIGKGDVYKEVAEAVGVSTTQVKAVLEATGECISNHLKKGEEVHFMGFMNFGIKEKKAQTKLNPFTGQKMKVAACKVPTVKLSAAFKKLLKK